MAESSVTGDSDVIAPYRFEPESLWSTSEESDSAMIPTARRVSLKDWATLHGALARNVSLCHVLSSAFVAASWQRLRNAWKAVMVVLRV